MCKCITNILHIIVNSNTISNIFSNNIPLCGAGVSGPKHTNNVNVVIYKTNQ